MDAGTARAIQQARQQVETDFTAVLHSLNAAVEELAGLQALAKGEGQQGLLLLQQAGDVEPALLAWACQRAGRPDQAEKILTDQVQQRPHEVLPLAQLVYFRNQQGRLQDARHGFDRLRSLAGQADLQTPALTRLTPLARTLGYPADWRLPQTPAAEARERPTLDSLGPAHWQPMKAPAWKLVDARGRSRSLAEFQGKPVVLMFYLGFGCLHCMEQLQAFAPRTDEFARAGIELVGISIEAEDTLKAGVQNYDPPFPFPLLANSNLEVFKAYHVYDDFQRKAMHGTFVIDGQGRIRWHDIRHEPFMDVQFVLDEARRLLQQTPAPAEETLMESSPRE